MNKDVYIQNPPGTNDRLKPSYQKPSYQKPAKSANDVVDRPGIVRQSWAPRPAYLPQTTNPARPPVTPALELRRNAAVVRQQPNRMTPGALAIRRARGLGG